MWILAFFDVREKLNDKFVKSIQTEIFGIFLAEFVIEASEEDSEQYTIYNASQDKYLTNFNATKYFEETAVY